MKKGTCTFINGMLLLNSRENLRVPLLGTIAEISSSLSILSRIQEPGLIEKVARTE